jgi:hypothetical protein
VQEEEPCKLYLGARDLPCNEFLQPAHAQAQVLIAQGLLVVALVDVALTSGTILDLLAIHA